MAYYHRVGAVPAKRHTQHRDASGALYYEELMGEEGFSSDSSLLYHRNIPSAISQVRQWQLPDQATVPNSPLKPLHLVLPTLFQDTASQDTASQAAASQDTAFQDTASQDTASQGTAGLDAVTGRRLVLGNADVRISYVVAGAPSPFYRNAIGDECIFVQAGNARVETVFGALEVAAGDYLILPRATTHRWLPTGDDPVRLYCIEANSHITPPKRYLSKYGQLLEHAPYCERDLRTPSQPLLAEADEPTEVYIKHRASNQPGGLAGSVHLLPHHPLDVVGWDGCLYPYVFNVADYEPITGRVHQPPPVHQVFEGNNFVICNFVPRKVDYHPLSIPVPYYHSNVDSDEVMFYVAGNYEARKGSGIGPGSISLHPGGHSHGPQPGAYEASIGVHYFDELAVMVDTFRPLEIGEGGQVADDGKYAWSWTGGAPSEQGASGRTDPTGGGAGQR